MATFVASHHLKDFNEWIKVFSANPPPQYGRWRLTRGIDDPNRVLVIGELEASEVTTLKDDLNSAGWQDVFRRVNSMSTVPVEFIWVEDLAA